jgi:hypothetical protein
MPRNVASRPARWQRVLDGSGGANYSVLVVPQSTQPVQLLSGAQLPRMQWGGAA